MPPVTAPRVTLRLVSSPPAASSPAPKGLAALVRHPDGSVTLDGVIVLPSHAERQAQLRPR